MYLLLFISRNAKSHIAILKMPSILGGVGECWLGRHRHGREHCSHAPFMHRDVCMKWLCALLNLKGEVGLSPPAQDNIERAGSLPLREEHLVVVFQLAPVQPSLSLGLGHCLTGQYCLAISRVRSLWLNLPTVQTELTSPWSPALFLSWSGAALFGHLCIGKAAPSSFSPCPAAEGFRSSPLPGPSPVPSAVSCGRPALLLPHLALPLLPPGGLLS